MAEKLLVGVLAELHLAQLPYKGPNNSVQHHNPSTAMCF